MSKRLVLLLCLLLIAVPGQAQDSEAQFFYDDCPMPIPAGETEGDTIECGYLIVPEVRGDPNSEENALAVAILYSPDPAPDPIIYLEGGPGGSALTGIDAWTDSPYRQTRDIILIDQRGTGYSEPTLDCDDYADAEDPDAACYDGLLEQGINLAGYNSRENAADIADLRLALGLNEVNLYGISYGTRLALTVMRDHPEGIRSVVLDSTYPPQANGFDEGGMHGATAILDFFAACAEDSACAEAYGDLETQFFALVDDWNEAPILSYDEEFGEEIEVTGDDLVNMLFQALYSSSAIPTLPYGIYLLANGDTVYGLETLGGTYSLEDLQAVERGEEEPEPEIEDFDEDVYIPDGDSEGMYNSVECNEEAPFNSIAASQQLSADLPEQLYSLQTSTEDMFTVCEYWDSGTADSIETQPVVSDIPTLILAGSLDPTTPAVWGQIAAEHLSQGYYAEVAYGGHGLIDAGDCPVNIGLEFMDNPGTAPDMSCLDATNFLFYVPAACTITAFAETTRYAGPGQDYATVGQVVEGQTIAGNAVSDDGENFWIRLADDGSWVNEFEVDYEKACGMQPWLTGE